MPVVGHQEQDAKDCLRDGKREKKRKTDIVLEQ